MLATSIGKKTNTQAGFLANNRVTRFSKSHMKIKLGKAFNLLSDSHRFIYVNLLIFLFID